MLRTIARVLLVLTVSLGLTPNTALAQRAIGRWIAELVGGVAINVVSASLLSGAAEPVNEADPPTPSSRPMTGYTFRVRWQMPEGTYVGTVSMWEASGTFSVRTPEGLTIDQDMEAVRLEEDAEDIWLLASNPRFAPGSEEREDYSYSPDHLRLTNVPGLGWTIPQTCFFDTDDKVRCSSVEVLEAKDH